MFTIYMVLYIYDGVNHYLEKFSWIDTGLSLLEQARIALSENKFQLFLTESDT